MKVMIDQALNSQLAARRSDKCRTMVLLLIDMLREHGMDASSHYDASISPAPGSRHEMNEISITDEEGRTASVLFVQYNSLIVVTVVGGCVDGPGWYAVNVPEADQRFDRFLKVAKEKKL